MRLLCLSCWMLLCLAFAGAARADQTGTDIVRENSKQLVVMIEGRVGSSQQEGAGIIVGSDRDALYIATADHVVREGDEPVADLTVRFRWSPKQPVAATLLPNRIPRAEASDSKLYDLAVVRVPRSAVPPFDLDALPLDRLRAEALDRGDDLYFIGFPQGRPWYGNVRPAKYAEPEGEQLTFETEAMLPGYSGGALLDSDLALVGLIVDTEGSFGTALNIRHVAEALKGWGVPSQLGLLPSDIRFETLAAGYAFSCGLDRKGFAYCWSGGAKATGQAGSGTIDDGQMDRLAGGLRFASLSVGPYHGCGITAAGDAYCFGDNDEGQLGGSTKEQFSPFPEPVTGGLKFRAISAGEGHSCGLTAEGKAYCWGKRWRDHPVAVQGDHSFDSIATGDGFSCALAKGRAWCWGDNGKAQLGRSDGHRSTSWTPRPISMDPTISLKQISAGRWHSCALTNQGQALCWGGNSNGQAGGSQYGAVATIPNMKFISISAGEESTCAIAADRSGWCWGSANHGALGGGWTMVIENKVIKDEDHSEPVAVLGDHKFRTLSTGMGYFACGLTDRRDMVCWGRRSRRHMDVLGDYGTTPIRIRY